MNKRIIPPGDPRWIVMQRRARVFASLGVPIRVGWDEGRTHRALRKFRKNPLYSAAARG